MNAVLRDVAVGVFLGQLFGCILQFRPGLGRFVRIQARFLEGVLVVVHNHGRALKRHAPGLATRLAVGHECGVKALEPRLVSIGLHKVVDGHDGIFIDQREHIGRQQHRSGGCFARLVRRQRLHNGFLVGTRINRHDFVLRVGLVEIRRVAVNRFGDGATHGNGVVKRHFHRRLRPGCGGHAQHGGCGRSLQEGLALHSDCSSRG